jgi:hypothetical protein
MELLAVSHDDAAVVFRVLQIVLGQDRISGRLGIARKRDVLLRDVCRSAPDLHVRAVRLEAARQRILVAFAMIVPATSAAVLLSLPH